MHSRIDAQVACIVCIVWDPKRNRRRENSAFTRAILTRDFVEWRTTRPERLFEVLFNGVSTRCHDDVGVEKTFRTIRSAFHST